MKIIDTQLNVAESKVHEEKVKISRPNWPKMTVASNHQTSICPNWIRVELNTTSRWYLKTRNYHSDTITSPQVMLVSSSLLRFVHKSNWSEKYRIVLNEMIALFY